MRTPLFSLKIKKNDAKGLRVGVVVGKSVEKTAAKRNFWKRQAKSVLHDAIRGNQDIILIVQPGVRTATRKEFRDALAKSAKSIR
ncbi:MAG TPA: ribonuclease P protein component [Candidatus Paceibacterota bacterium]|nr:ribonuclease P protein component [Candidatus Paceibacterota bacterium]